MRAMNKPAQQTLELEQYNPDGSRRELWRIVWPSAQGWRERRFPTLDLAEASAALLARGGCLPTIEPVA
jgi:hypothetical protein